MPFPDLSPLSHVSGNQFSCNVADILDNPEKLLVAWLSTAGAFRLSTRDVCDAA